MSPLLLYDSVIGKVGGVSNLVQICRGGPWPTSIFPHHGSIPVDYVHIFCSPKQGKIANNQLALLLYSYKAQCTFQ